MKIIKISNFDNDYVSDILVCENINLWDGTLITNLLNEKASDYSKYYHKLVDDDYELHKFEP